MKAGDRLSHILRFGMVVRREVAFHVSLFLDLHLLKEQFLGRPIITGHPSWESGAMDIDITSDVQNNKLWWILLFGSYIAVMSNTIPLKSLNQYHTKLGSPCYRRLPQQYTPWDPLSPTNRLARFANNFVFPHLFLEIVMNNHPKRCGAAISRQRCLEGQHRKLRQPKMLSWSEPTILVNATETGKTQKNP